MDVSIAGLRDEFRYNLFWLEGLNRGSKAALPRVPLINGWLMARGMVYGFCEE